MMHTRVGNPSVLAIESVITEAYESPGQRALGFFVIELGGKAYGVRSPDATLLACSLDAIRRRIERRGRHFSEFGAEADAFELVDAFRAATYSESRQGEVFFGMSADELRIAFCSNEIVWAPDGDAAFDDGSHVLQFDAGDSVRLIGFKNADDDEAIASTVAEVWMTGDDYYGLLEKWQGAFETAWRVALQLDAKPGT